MEISYKMILLECLYLFNMYSYFLPFVKWTACQVKCMSRYLHDIRHAVTTTLVKKAFYLTLIAHFMPATVSHIWKLLSESSQLIQHWWISNISSWAKKARPKVHTYMRFYKQKLSKVIEILILQETYLNNKCVHSYLWNQTTQT